MRILYVTNESPIFPSGGIGTYIGYMASAMAQAGHEVFLLTWTYQPQNEQYNYWPFTADTTHICYLDSRQVNKSFPHGPYNYAVSAILSDTIIKCAAEWRIDVIESADFLAPCLSAFQRIQSTRLHKKILCATFNHGFIEDYNDADQLASSVYTQNELTSERQQLRSSDLILTPSVSARSRLYRYGIKENIVVTREPYEFQVLSSCDKASASMQFLGRLSLSKGIDKLILLANLMHSTGGLEDVVFIGKEDRIPFLPDPRSYILQRLIPGLRDKVRFIEEKPRHEALTYLRPGSFFPAMGSAETFSFACLEAIDRGLLPVVMSGTPMASFFPEDIKKYLLNKDECDIRKWQRTLESIASDASAIVSRLQQFNQQELDPSRIAQKIGVLYDTASKKKRRHTTLFGGRRAQGSELSILVAVTERGNIQAVIDAVCAQTIKVRNVLICHEQNSIELSLLEYIRLRLPNCVLIEQPMVGRSALYNRLLQETQTKLCVLLDEYTIIAPRFLEKTLRAYNETALRPQVVLAHQYKYGTKTGKIIQQFMGDHIHFLRNDMGLCALIETGVARKIGFDVTRRNGEDLAWAFWLTFHRSGYKHILLPEFLVNCFRHSTSEEGATIGGHVMVREVLRRVGPGKAEHEQLAMQALFARQRAE